MDVRVTEAESELLEALWRCGPLPPARLFAEVQARRPWRNPTIKTLLARLMRKGVLRAERIDGRLVYQPLVDRGAYVEAEVDDLVRRVFDGDPQALTRFLETRAAPPDRR
jgi:predicted transcriptional regulator